MTIIGRAMLGQLPDGNEDLEIKVAIAAVLASLTATLTALTNLVVLLQLG